MILNKIFDLNNNNIIIEGIILSLTEKIDLKKRLEEKCTEMDIYCEQILDEENQDEEENDEKQNERSDIFESLGYGIFNNNEFDNNEFDNKDIDDIFKPFIITKLVRSQNQIINLLIYLLLNHRKSVNIIRENHITLENYYNEFKLLSNNKSVNYVDFYEYLVKNKKLPEYISIGFIYNLISAILNIKIILIDNNMNITEINNSYNLKNDPIIIYMDSEKHILNHNENKNISDIKSCVTLYDLNKIPEFIITTTHKKNNKIIKEFENGINKNWNNYLVLNNI
jgi:hypothetical protein